MSYGTRALVVVNVGGGDQGDVVLNKNILPRNLQSLKHWALNLACMLKGKVDTCCSVEGAVRCKPGNCYIFTL